MIEVNISYNGYRNYLELSSSIISGSAFYDGKLYKEQDLAKLVDSWESEIDFYNELEKLNGFYAIIKKEKDCLYAAVDRVRSIPLFYGQKNEHFYLSDDAEWVCEKLGDKKLDPQAKEEFFLSGYVAGRDTLFPQVKQLQAGESLIVRQADDGLEVEIKSYYKYFPKYGERKVYQELIAEHDQILLNVFNRLIKMADGRTLVIPLSGGYDSRLNALMLKKLGYHNIVTYTYGRTGNAESEVSKKLADSLCLKWEFVEYSNELWYQWYHSTEYKKYSKFAAGCVSLPHIQDWPAVWQLKQNNKIPKDSIFVPGHSGDFISSGYISRNLTKREHISDTDLLNAIMFQYYNLFDLDKLDDSVILDLKEKIISLLNINKNQGKKEATGKYEKFGWREFQSKYIVNSVRVYDFWNYNWWTPLWDYEYMEYWLKVPLKYRIRRKLYIDYVNRLSLEIMGHIIPKDSLNPSYTQKLKPLISPYINNELKSNIQGLLNGNKDLLKEYNSHPLAIWGIYKQVEYLEEVRKFKNINSVLVSKHIKMIKN